MYIPPARPEPSKNANSIYNTCLFLSFLRVSIDNLPLSNRLEVGKEAARKLRPYACFRAVAGSRRLRAGTRASTLYQYTHYMCAAFRLHDRDDRDTDIWWMRGS